MSELIAQPIPANGKIEQILTDVGDYRILCLKPQDTFARKLFPVYAERCRQFIETTDSDTDPIWLLAMLFNNFHNATNLIHCLVALDKDEKIAAHSLTYVENTYKLGLHGHVLQLWRTGGNTEILDAGLPLIESWARELKLKTLIFSADSLAKLRLYESRFGFKLHRIFGRKDLADGPG